MANFTDAVETGVEIIGSIILIGFMGFFAIISSPIWVPAWLLGALVIYFDGKTRDKSLDKPGGIYGND